MALRIRLSRGGSKKRPYYRIVVADVRAPRDGRFIERIGHYNPLLPHDHHDRIAIDSERASYWLGIGAKPSDRVEHFFDQAGLLKAKARPEQTKQHLPKAKAQERLRQMEEASESAASA
ncbi:MAG: 30S ribosomal protein S16 [Pseudomonadota bacterium]